MDILIDLDGTLQDPALGIIGSVQIALRGLSLPVPDKSTLGWVIGPPLRQSFPELGVAPADIDRALELYRAHYRAGAMFDAVIYDGIPHALEVLRAQNHRLIVATSKPHVFARPIIEHFRLTQHFAAIHGSELDGTRDDKADLIAHIIATERVDPQRAIMIGDRKFDVLGAARNAIACVGALWGHGSADELTAAGAAHLASSPRDLPALIAKAMSA